MVKKGDGFYFILYLKIYIKRIKVKGEQKEK